MRLGIATYNIHSCVGSDGRYDPDRTLDVLREIDADVIALQEVDSREHKGLELLACLAHESGFEAIPGPTLLRQTGRFGNAILTRLKIRETRRLDLTYTGREPRGAIDVELECGDIRLQVIATHLGLKPAERRTQVKQLLDRFETKHCVLMGDLNEWFLWGRPLRWLQAIFGKMPAPLTFPARYPILALDRIWVRPLHSLVSLQVHATPLARVASDHLPLKAVITCVPPESGAP
jgi:endonuclease/exonuclease/phosphatase family metal-dependent hydrolase